MFSVGRRVFGRVLRSYVLSSTRPASTTSTSEVHESCPVNSYNEWDPLEEVILGSPEGYRTWPLDAVNMKVSISII